VCQPSQAPRIVLQAGQLRAQLKAIERLDKRAGYCSGLRCLL